MSDIFEFPCGGKIGFALLIYGGRRGVIKDTYLVDKIRHLSVIEAKKMM